MEENNCESCAKADRVNGHLQCQITGEIDGKSCPIPKPRQPVTERVKQDELHEGEPRPFWEQQLIESRGLYIRSERVTEILGSVYAELSAVEARVRAEYAALVEAAKAIEHPCHVCDLRKGCEEPDKCEVVANYEKMLCVLEAVAEKTKRLTSKQIDPA